MTGNATSDYKRTSTNYFIVRLYYRPSFTLHVSVRGASFCRMSLAVRWLLGFESNVSIALLFAAPTINPLLQEQR